MLIPKHSSAFQIEVFNNGEEYEFTLLENQGGGRYEPTHRDEITTESDVKSTIRSISAKRDN